MPGLVRKAVTGRGYLSFFCQESCDWSGFVTKTVIGRGYASRFVRKAVIGRTGS